MKINVFLIGKSSPSFIQDGVDIYKKRIGHFCKFQWTELSPKKKVEDPKSAKSIDADLFLQNLKPSDYVVLLDEKGRPFKSSYNFSEYLNKKQVSGMKTLIFVIGGSHGFGERIYLRANEKVSLATMTFSHQMIRLIFLEQLYRGLAILNNLPYHHD